MVFYILMGVICAFVCVSMARSKNRETGLWGVLGFFFGIFAVIILAVLEKRPVEGAMTYQGAAGGQASPGSSTPAAMASAPPAASTADELAQWKRLLDDGAIDEDEFRAKKAELLARS
ncbi:SHOCT domain-containing protein [Paraurantiacibacter namhicola]|uniref:SHOCT domain-containing protein n=1 Tax=Paraurantiacibacter namhicola TaxID=645517 RepID=A0A1C7D733_9SPHN|nr:SHOCT domain-containing protein [Paraurantiacibacter namhicola]ANU07257.1 hypothetical protein A6F65_00947 [Paraurantiacibacter namhicola]